MTVSSKAITMSITMISTMTKVHLLLASINNTVMAAMAPSLADEGMILKKTPRLFPTSP